MPGASSTFISLLRFHSSRSRSIAKVNNYAPFKVLVTASGLIGRGFMDSLERALEGYVSQYFDTQTSYTLTQPFEINLEDIHTRIGILTTRGHGHIITFGLFRDQRTSSPSQFPYRGRVLVHLEISPLPEHARPASRPPVLVLRVLKIITAIEYSPEYDMHSPMPVEGGLLSKKRGKTVSSPIIFDLEKIKPDSTTLGGLYLLVE
ncbi:hypothetical protein DXG03_004160 [Asterophora parasitica]|uniref:Uncharacterized protein n=1 Tax=Asterophora parasitica TaxID=117018 RepID=A0A9P7K950_9AGAR|nr:hypothetical protein DXG03_004160 [Asterophora parasitica]